MIVPWRVRLASRRAQHLVYLAHVWVCSPFLVMWLMDIRVLRALGDTSVAALQPVIVLTLLYLAVRTWLAWRDPPWLRWEIHFPPIDVVIITAIIALSHTGPIGNLSILYVLPIVSAAMSLDVRWSAIVGLMVVAGTAVATVTATSLVPPPEYQNLRELLRAEPLNAAFRVVFIVVLSSLMAFQALIVAGLKERLAVAADRNRIALDMHDGVQGHLIALSQQLELLGRVAESNPTRAVELAHEGRESARKAADELRFLVQRLRTPAIQDGFASALRHFAHTVTSRCGLELEFRVTGDEVALEPDTENALFRIAQEALTNVIKHAEATGVTIEVSYSPDEVKLTLEDDGRGLDEARADGVGLESIRTRARERGGKATVEGATRGTRVVAIVPNVKRI